MVTRRAVALALVALPLLGGCAMAPPSPEREAQTRAEAVAEETWNLFTAEEKARMCGVFRYHGPQWFRDGMLSFEHDPRNVDALVLLVNKECP